MEERICAGCGQPFRKKGQNTMCYKCISAVLSEELETDERPIIGFAPIYKPRKGKTQLERDVKAASNLGISYGEYIASVKHRK